MKGGNVIMKSNNKSVRLDDYTYNYVLNYRGDGFNEKFENIVYDASKAEAERKLNISRLDSLIELKRSHIDDLDKKILMLKRVSGIVDNVISSIELIDNIVNGDFIENEVKS